MMPPVHIVSVGARTPLGLHAAASAAAYRAGISAMAEHPFMVDQAGDPMPAAMDAELDPEMMGPQRLVALAEAAIEETGAPLRNLFRNDQLRIPLYLGLPEIRPGFSQSDADLVQSRLSKLDGLPIAISEVHISTQGHAAGLAAITKANERIQQGGVDACLVGGVDSYFQPDTMEWLDGHRQLVGSVSRSAFVPGEAAGFCLLMSGHLQARLGLEGLARVAGAAVGRDAQLIKTSDVCFGTGLTRVIERAVQPLAPSFERVNRIVCDINGERYRSEEWGFVCVKLSRYFDDPTAYDSPADCWGDTGAASGPLFAMLTCQAATRGYAKGPRTLLWASSEGGLRGAVVLECAPGL